MNTLKPLKREDLFVKNGKVYRRETFLGISLNRKIADLAKADVLLSADNGVRLLLVFLNGDFDYPYLAVFDDAVPQVWPVIGWDTGNGEAKIVLNLATEVVFRLDADNKMVYYYHNI